jgi:hypothetical protein
MFEDTNTTMTRVEEFLERSSQRLWRSYQYVRQTCVLDEQSRRLIGPPYYTDHGYRHSLRMLHMLDMFLFYPFGPFLITPELTPEDAYAMVCSIFTHDIGMRGSALVPAGEGSEVQLRRDFARKMHAERSERYLLRNELIEWDDRSFPRPYREAIGRICGVHNKPMVLLDQSPDHLGIREAFCAAILKALDCLDFSNRRIGVSDIRSEAVPIGNMIFGWKHYYVEDALIVPHISPKDAVFRGRFMPRLQLVVRYSLPTAWKGTHYAAGEPEKGFDVNNPYHVIRGLAERHVRYAHGDVPRILRDNGIDLELGSTISKRVDFDDTDSDGGPKMDFQRHFLERLDRGIATPEEVHEIRAIINDTQKTFTNVLEEGAASLIHGMPQCEETLEVLRHLARFGSLAKTQSLLKLDEYRTVVATLLRQRVLREDGSGNAYVLDGSSTEHQCITDFMLRYIRERGT